MSTEYTTQGNGTETNYSFTFPYLKQSDVKVTVAGTAQTNPTHWTWHNATTVKFNTAPANLSEIRIYRETDDTKLSATFYAGSSIKSQDLNDNFTQNLYVTQEVRDDSALALTNSREHDGDGTYTSAISKSNTAVSTSNTASTNASAAVATANTASTNASNAVTTANTASTNATNAVNTANTASTNATTALNNSRESDGSGGYNTAISIANTAKSTADSATTTANTASTNASSAVTTANSASSTANTASTNASSAVTTANTASTNATTALNNSRESDGSGGYNSAISIANSATTTANTALSNSRESDGSGGFNTAISIANTAKSTADTSAATVANSAIYQVVANYAALPALNSVDNGKYYQVTDSTNIENNFSDITGEPSGFTGHSGLTVKLKSNTTASPKVWEWQEYYANDPEIRYRKKLIVENLHTLDENYTIGTNNNAFSVGPVVVAANKTVTIPANSLYFIG